MPNGDGIQKDTFIDADDKTRISMTFDLLHEIREGQVSQRIDCNKRFLKIENKRKLDTVIAGGSGFLAGFVAVAAKFKIWG